jgi:hypothetical protein
VIRLDAPGEDYQPPPASYTADLLRDEAEGKAWTLSADSTVVRAHQHAAGARRALPADLVTGAASLRE